MQAPPSPSPAASSSAAAGAGQDPQLRDALKRVRQLDGALDAACTRAAAVAEKGRALEAALEAAEEQGEGADSQGGSEEAPAGGEGSLAGLAAAMRRERRRLLQDDRLQAALQDGAPEGSRGCGDGGQDGDACAAAGPTVEQERLVEALLREGGAAEAAATSPYDAATAELAAIDARLAELQGGQDDAGAAGQPPVGCGAAAPAAAQEACCLAGGDSWEQDVAAAKASFLRRVYRVWIGSARCMRKLGRGRR